jgi:hypothetical protein
VTIASNSAALKALGIGAGRMRRAGRPAIMRANATRSLVSGQDLALRHLDFLKKSRILSV